MKKQLISLLFILNVVTSQAQTINRTHDLKLPQDAYLTLLARIKAEGIKSENVKVEIDRFGFVASVVSKQDKLKAILSQTMFVPHVSQRNDLMPEKTILTVTNTGLQGVFPINVKQDSIAGQLYTAVMLSTFMHEKKYARAIDLFSEKYRARIGQLKTAGKIDPWISAWTFDTYKLERYLTRIAFGQGLFAYEGGRWRVNEN